MRHRTVFARRKIMSMSISGSTSLASLFQTSNTSSSQQVNGQQGDMPPPPPKGEKGGGLMSALTDALSKLGISLDGTHRLDLKN
jgi:hypothetical protein